MILADPIDVGAAFSSYRVMLKPYIGKTILVKTGDTIALEEITKKCIMLDNGMKWCIIGSAPSICFMNINDPTANKQCSMDELLDWMKVAYPDCFDWLLFHPEWLR